MKPNLHGTRVALRTIRRTDAEDLFEIYGNDQTMAFASDPPFTSFETVYQMMASVTRLEQEKESFEWAILELSSNKVIGTCGIHSFSLCGTSCEVGCLLNVAYWRQGYMSEALSLLFGYAKSIGIKMLVADIDASNLRSRAFFESMGFEFQSGIYKRLL